ncbi:endonuclease [Halioxenophilus aromaticivorans]|uniref:Endonuclease n=1 Tax=Halioxenophilus aromaticivorans TaxID=1306992 RepID=A0AAV3U486_9ALTE
MTLLNRILFLAMAVAASASQAQSNCSGSTLAINLLTDNYASETQWQLRNAAGQALASSTASLNNNTLYEQDLCLTEGNYSFTITDSYGDGICCGYGNGYFQLLIDGEEIANGGQFGDEETVPISITAGTDTSCSGHALELALNTDNYGSETQWDITLNGQQVASGGGYSSNQSYTEALCLADGNYTLTVTDSYGDGMCCSQGNGGYSLSLAGKTLASGGEFSDQQTRQFSLPIDDGGDGGGGGDNGGGGGDLEAYYASAAGLSGYALKSELHSIIGNHTTQSYGALWDFYLAYETDSYYENNYTILDIYSENPQSADPYNFTPGSDQCGTYNSEADCYNREHSFPRSWFGGSVAPMNSDVHHIFATDGQVNAWRGSYPFGEVGSASRTSQNGSLLGSARSGLGYSGTVFEPIDQFKGDLARAYFYMATRYQDRISGWQNNSSYGNAVLDGSSQQVFETWHLEMLKRWHNEDPVSQKELDRNDDAEQFQGNRNPFVDHPEWVESIW